MQRKDAEREEARRLRAEGWSLNRIAAHLGVAKSSVSVWVRDIPGPPRAPKEPAAPRAVASVPARDGEAAKQCPKCDRRLTLASFNRMGEGRQHWCRECFSAYFRERGALHREQVARAAARRKEEARALLRERFGRECCRDCGEDEILVLELDHRGEKVLDVARLLGQAARPERVEREMAKCDVVCVNCHRRRTAARRGTFRFTRTPRASWSPALVRNQRWALDHLLEHPCVDCGETDPVVLDFDHRGTKTMNVSRLLRFGTLARLKAEVGECEVRCANCHRIRTLSATPTWRDQASPF